VPVADRGLHYGDGLFETIAVVAGQPCLWDRHLSRLRLGCERLAIPVTDPAQLRREADTLCRGVERGVLKLLLTRGEGGRGYRPPLEPVPRRILSLHPWPDHPSTSWQQGVRIRWCDTPLGLNPRLAGIKHCNRLEQVMARAEWSDPGIAEGLMCDADGQVVEGTQSNLFLWRGGELLTPSLARCGVAGIGRGLLMELAGESAIRVREGAVSRDQVMAADGLLLSNALIGVWPVAALGEHNFDPAHYPRDLLARMMERIHLP
jgi:4-amino-4-deoxychorismate lyase